MRHDHTPPEPILHDLSRILHGDGLSKVPGGGTSDLSDRSESDSIEFTVPTVRSPKGIKLLSPIESVCRRYRGSDQRLGSQDLHA
jgi:hypothetical protein